MRRGGRGEETRRLWKGCGSLWNDVKARAGNGLAVKKNVPDDASAPEVLAKPQRRRFTAEYKLRILKEADGCKEDGQIGQLLRREGLYSSHLSNWRKQRDEGALSSMQSKKRGRRSTGRNDPTAREVDRLRKENLRLQDKLRQAEAIIEIQKKVSEVLAIQMNDTENEGSDS